MKELYFCLYLTESEHCVVNMDLATQCEKHGCNLLYYRELKNGHIPMYREVKIVGENINRIKAFIRENLLHYYIISNPHKTNK